MDWLMVLNMMKKYYSRLNFPSRKKTRNFLDSYVESGVKIN